MDDKTLRSWVSDQLHALLGYSEGATVAYIVGLGDHPSTPAGTRIL
jgi:hypothetical protein